MKNVIISNPNKLNKLKKRFKEGGLEKIQIISDFDRNLTKAFVDGKIRPSFVSVLRDGGVI